MHNKKLWLTALLLTAGLSVSGGGITCSAEDTNGELVFAQCKEYINIRTDADESSEVVGKIYNHSAAFVTETNDGWYKIKSGNAVGYVKAEYFATGEEADTIAKDVAYNVAVVHAKALNVRTSPNEESTVVDVAEQNDELEVVNYDGGWMTVALGNDVYGFISPDYCEYKTYYPTAVTLEEEAAANKADDHKAHAVHMESVSSETAPAVEEAPAVETEVQPDTEAVYTEEAYTAETEAQPDTEAAYTEETYTEETEAQPDTEAAYTEETYTEETETQPDTEAAYTEEAYTEETEAPYVEETYTEETEAPAYEESYVEQPADTGLGQQIVDYACQFVGNPYVYGGSSLTNGTDCSGFTMSVMSNFGIYLPRTAADQAYSGTSISVSDVQPGDLLFYSEGGGISHVGLYIGGGQIVHASTESTGIIISDAYYSTPVAAARYI